MKTVQAYEHKTSLLISNLLSSVHDKPGKSAVGNRAKICSLKRTQIFYSYFHIFQEAFNQESIKYLMFLDKQAVFLPPTMPIHILAFHVALSTCRLQSTLQRVGPDHPPPYH